MYARMALILEMLRKSSGEVPPRKHGTHPASCQNPRCITKTEAYLPHLFREEGGMLVCQYCDERNLI